MEYEIVRRVVAEVLQIGEEEIRPESLLTDDLGADSMDLLRIMLRLEEEFKTEITYRETLSMETVHDVADQLGRHK
ncbi:MAG: acyl carrier protein [Lachnospiraceae bacterium]|jgi:acyl carrier protein|nr:acyl carrier protein [Lachnospiraceae bacterium]MCI1657248.1 acyl carrier protein [Lachnospiraceae bacterium]MCI2195716.1 acyl carrier protein [Lachnospiraceae bacterium]